MWTSINRSESRAGFSLLEVMLAVLLLGVSLTVFFSAVNQGVFFTVTAKDHHMYREFIHHLNLLEPLDLEDLEEGETSGSFQDEQFGGWMWRRTLSLVGEEEDQLFHVRTQVWKQGELPEKGESVETFIHQPSAQAAGWVQEPVDDF